MRFARFAMLATLTLALVAPPLVAEAEPRAPRRPQIGVVYWYNLSAEHGSHFLRQGFPRRHEGAALGEGSRFRARHATHRALRSYAEMWSRVSSRGRWMSCSS